MTGGKTFPRIMLCAPGSGSGKTMITCALLKVLERHGFKPASFKCGPDYIDPMFHKDVLGIPSRNMDIFLMGREGVNRTLARGSRDRDFGVIEGVFAGAVGEAGDDFFLDVEEGDVFVVAIVEVGVVFAGEELELIVLGLGFGGVEDGGVFRHVGDRLDPRIAIFDDLKVQ